MARKTVPQFGTTSANSNTHTENSKEAWRKVMRVCFGRETGLPFGNRTTAIGAGFCKASFLRRVWVGVNITLVIALYILTTGSPSAQAQSLGYRVQSGDGGGSSLAPVQNLAHRDFAYGYALNSAPTGEASESKLWWNDGSWWGSLYSPAAQAFHIFQLDNASHTWVDTGTALDSRPGSKADVLWDGVNQKLYVVSHLFNSVGQTTSSPSEWGRLYRLSYSAGTGSYSLDQGFPVNVTRGVGAALTLAKDSRGVLWVTFVENNQVMINHSTTSDLNWGTPLALSVGSASGRLSSGDLSAAITFQGDKLGVMWSNQANGTFSFAVHNDGEADTAWQHSELALGGSNSACSGACARPSINLKTDGTGRVFAAVGTAVTSPSDAPRALLLVRDMTGGWTNSVFGTASENHGNPTLLLDEEAGQLSMFASSPAIGGAIYAKTSGLNNIQFSAGLGSALIQSSTDMAISNATSTKQNISGATGTVVSASDPTTHYYLSATILPAIAPAISSFTPTSGPVGTNVSISGTNFSAPATVTFNGTAATSVTVSSGTLIVAAVPAGATFGPISVTDSAGTGTSSTSFTVVPKITSFSPSSGPLGTAVTLNGSGFTGVTAVTFDAQDGTPATFTVVSDSKITTSVPGGATSGKIYLTNGHAISYSNSAFTVTSTAAPAISSFTPTSGVTGTSVTITGTNFTGTTAVAFNGVAAAIVKGISDTTLSATVPSAATSGPISVTNSVSTGTSSTSFTVLPKFSSFSPASGTAGTSVTIAGSGFAGATHVAFNGIAATFTVNSAIQITAAVPSGATTGKISVTTPAGTAISTTSFTVTSTITPTVTSFTPTSGTVGASVTVTGTGFTGATAVAFNGTKAAGFTVSSDTTLSAKVPSGATSGKISVTNTVGTGTSSTSFTVLMSISSFSPTSGSMGTAVTITGNGFTGATSLAFDHLSTTSFTVVSNTQITTTVPGGADSGKINVTNGGVTAFSSGSFTVNSSAAPTISSFTPASGPTGTVVTVTGTNFTGITGVAFNGTAVGLFPNFTPISDTQFMATVPGAASNGPIKVTNTLGSATSSTNFTVTPKITSFSPTSGTMGTAVTVTGTGFTGVSSVVFDHLVQPTFTVVNSTTITTTVPGGAISGKLNVTGGGATVYSTASFTVNSSAAPTISSFTPASGPTGTVVTVTGSHFTGLTGVTFNGTQAGLLYPAFKAVSDSQFSIAVPGAASTGAIKVTNTVGNATSSTNYTVTPKITSFTPTSGAVGAVVTITGSGFTGATSVTFHGTAATFTVVNSNTISATVPAGATTGKLTVTGAGVTVFSNGTFTVL
jgi:IPT/TIG domain-containing protein